MTEKSMLEEAIELLNETRIFIDSNSYNMEEFMAAKAKVLKSKICKYLEVKGEDCAQPIREDHKERKSITIWIESGEHHGNTIASHQVDTFIAEDFHDAIRQFKIAHTDVKVEDHISEEGVQYTVWGLKLFEQNE